jgi:uncharacterized protein DUF1573
MLVGSTGKAGFLTAVMLAISCVPAAAQDKTAPVRVPRIVVPFTGFDFGDIYKGEVISQIFVIRNEGDADLNLEFSAACACEVTAVDRVIPPGKEGKAQIELDTSSQAGVTKKFAVLHSNDPDKPDMMLSLSANVLTSPVGGGVSGVALRQGKYVGPLFVGPATFWGFRSFAGKTGRVVFDISADKTPVRITRVEGHHDLLVTRLESVQEGKTYKLIIESTSNAPPGAYNAEFILITDSPVLPRLPIGVSFRVEAAGSTGAATPQR